MAEFTPNKKTAQDFNNGVQYIDADPEQGIEGDRVQAETINNLVESALYSQQVANNAMDATQQIPPVGYHYIQFNGESTPAQRWANTDWIIDTQYQGRTIVGSGYGYVFGGTGGSADAVLLAHKHAMRIMASETTDVFGKSAYIKSGLNSRENTINDDGVAAETVSNNALVSDGTGKNMPPYVVVNIWVRTL